MGTAAPKGDRQAIAFKPAKAMHDRLNATETSASAGMGRLQNNSYDVREGSRSRSS
jgi:hypothetical protein